jgi:hypothetical protein
MLAIAIGVKCSSPGAIIFRQRRYGLDGKEITVYKFRTMRVMEDGADIPQAHRDDPRITRFGALLRRTSLDELPQLINARGDRRRSAPPSQRMYRKLIMAIWCGMGQAGIPVLRRFGCEARRVCREDAEADEYDLAPAQWSFALTKIIFNRRTVLKGVRLIDPRRT